MLNVIKLFAKLLGVGALLWVFVASPIFLFWWSGEPDAFDVATITQERVTLVGQTTPVVGQATVATTIRLTKTLLDKPGGFLANDYATPGVLMDNMPSYEVEAIVQLRIMADVLRQEHSIFGGSKPDKDLVAFDTLMSSNTDWFMFPSAEGQYEEAVLALERYFVRLGDANQQDGQFYARADNLVAYLDKTSKQLKSISDLLGENIGMVVYNQGNDLDPSAEQSTPVEAETYVQNPWLQIDNVWWRARGGTWVILNLLKAHEIDFQRVLADKNATTGLQKAIRELEATQAEFSSPMVTNGDKFGLLSNYSLSIAKHIAAANIEIQALHDILKKG